MTHRHFEFLIRLFYPASCEVCRQRLSLDEKNLCLSCRETLNALAWPLEETLADEPFEYLDHVWTAFAYRSPVREVLHGIKYKRKSYLMEIFREPTTRLAQAITTAFHHDALIPIPIERFKLVQRHFNQAELLAGLIRRQVSTPLRCDLLRKGYATPSQTSLSRQERAINVYGAFKLGHKTAVRGGAFLLLDDVLTTGATANEAARVLKIHGAKRVDFLALTRAVHPST